MNDHTFTPPLQVIQGQTRILLSESASRHLTQAGEGAFVIASKAVHPDMPGRWVIHLVPVDFKTACAAAGVIAGTHTARRSVPRTTKAANPSE